MKVKNLIDINTEKEMYEFCKKKLSFEERDYTTQLDIERNVLLTSYNNDYIIVISKFYPLQKVINLYNKTKDNFFLQAFVYAKNMMFNFKETAKLVDCVDVVNECTYKTQFNINIALDQLEEHDTIIKLTSKTKKIKLLIQQGLALQKTKKYDKAIKLYKQISKMNISEHDRSVLHFRFAEIYAIKNDKESLKKQVSILENQYLKQDCYCITSYEISKYSKILGDTQKSFSFLLKSANFYAFSDISIIYKIRAIRELKSTYGIYSHRAFEQELINEEYIKLKEAYLKDWEGNNLNYTFV